MDSSNIDTFQYYLEKKEAYERNLKNGIGHKKSIELILHKINIKLIELNKDGSCN